MTISRLGKKRACFAKDRCEKGLDGLSDFDGEGPAFHPLCAKSVTSLEVADTLAVRLACTSTIILMVL